MMHPKWVSNSDFRRAFIIRLKAQSSSHRIRGALQSPRHLPRPATHVQVGPLYAATASTTNENEMKWARKGSKSIERRRKSMKIHEQTRKIIENHAFHHPNGLPPPALMAPIHVGAQDVGAHILLGAVEGRVAHLERARNLQTPCKTTLKQFKTIKKNDEKR